MRSRRLSRKGITPVISVIVLLFITIALLATAWQFLFGYIEPTISTSFDIPPNGAFCQFIDGAGYRISVYVKNTGTGTLVEDDFIATTVDGQDVVLSQLPLHRGSPAARVIYYPLLDTECSRGSCKGFHSVTLGTSAGIRNIDVFCP